jgi:hypothetical protein
MEATETTEVRQAIAQVRLVIERYGDSRFQSLDDPDAKPVNDRLGYRTEWDEKARAFKKTPEHNWASHGADAWRYLSLSWRAPMREPEEEKVPFGIPLPDLTMDEFMDIEDSWSKQEDRV